MNNEAPEKHTYKTHSCSAAKLRGRKQTKLVFPSGKERKRSLDFTPPQKNVTKGDGKTGRAPTWERICRVWERGRREGGREREK